MTKKDILQVLVALLVISGFIFGALNYLAKASDLELVAQRLDQKIANDKIYEVKKMIFLYEDKYKNKPCSEWPEKDREQYRYYLKVLKDLEYERDSKKK